MQIEITFNSASSFLILHQLIITICLLLRMSNSTTELGNFYPTGIPVMYLSSYVAFDCASFGYISCLCDQDLALGTDVTCCRAEKMRRLPHLGKNTYSVQGYCLHGLRHGVTAADLETTQTAPLNMELHIVSRVVVYVRGEGLLIGRATRNPTCFKTYPLVNSLSDLREHRPYSGCCEAISRALERRDGQGTLLLLSSCT